MTIEHIINIDDEFGKTIGFTSDKFDGYLWRVDNSIYISYIFSKQMNQGNLSTLFDKILELGYTIKVPTPLKKMKSILEKKGFNHVKEYWPEQNEYVDVYVYVKGNEK